MQPDMTEQEQTEQLTDGLASSEGNEPDPIDSDFDPSKAWINELPEQYKNKQTFHKFSKGEGVEMVSVPGTFLDSYENLEGMLSDKKRLPETEDEQRAFYEDLGWKSDYEEYAKGLERREMPEDVEYNTEEEEFLLQMAHEAKVPLSEAQKRYDQYVDNKLSAIENAEKAHMQMIEAAKQANEKEFGTDLPVIEKRALAVMEDYKSDDLVDMFNTVEGDGIELGSHPKMVGFVAKLGKDKLGLGDERGQTHDETMENIDDQIAELRNAPEYYDGTHVNHARAVEKMDRLWMKKTGQI